MAKIRTIIIFETMLQICSNIKQARLSRKVSQGFIAKKMNIERNTYKNWEINTEPSLSTIKTIAKILEVPAMSLLTGLIEFGGAEIIQANKIQKMGDIEDIRISLNRLTSAIGRLSGLEKDEIEVFLPSYASDKKGVFQDLMNTGGRKKNGGKQRKA